MSGDRTFLQTAIDFIQERINPWLVLFYSSVVLVCFLVAPLFYYQTVRRPFLGAFVEHTLMLNTAQPTQSGSWEISKLDLPYGYQLTSIDEHQLTHIDQLYAALGHYKPGNDVRITLRDPQGNLVVYPIKLHSLPFLDRLSYFFIPYLTGLVYLACGLYVFVVRRHDPAGRAFSLFAAACAISLGGLYDLYTTNRLTMVWTASLALAGGALFNLALLFPEPTRLARQHPYLRWLGYIPAGILALFSLPTIYNYAAPTAYVAAWRFEFVFLGLAVVFFLVLVAMRRRTASSPIVREQARLIFWGALLGFTLIAGWFIISPITPSLQFSALLVLPMGVFPVFTAYAIIRYRLLNTDFVLSRAVLYGTMTVLVIAAYALLVSGASQIFGSIISPTNPLLIGLVVFLLALGLNPLRTIFQNKIDAVFFRGQAIYQERQGEFGRELTGALELSEILALLRRYVDQALMPSQAHLFIYDTFTGLYIASPDGVGDLTSDLRFPPSSALVETLSKQREGLFIADIADISSALQADKARLALLGAQLFLPLSGRNQLIGWLALGSRSSGEPYSSSDVEFLESLCDQSALAVERAQVVGDLERRIREMNALSRVAQGISFTTTFDDILELLAAQTNQILPARDLRLTLRDEDGDTLYHAFYLEDDERISEKEGVPLLIRQGLEAEVVDSQQSLITDDYERACRGRGLLPSAEGIYAWMGVPLNAGARTIGVLSVASRDTSVVYTIEQRNLLQAVADQASGAIVKARLLEESQRRARQLAMLNEIGIGLTSTLALKPLLNQILQSATEIINCDAGSLFLVDPQTDELVFEVVLGPVAENLVGRRLPPGAGLVGEAVQTGKAIIANDAKRRKEWHEKTDEQTGFDTQDLLVVPMRLQDRVIGVIEVINKRSGAPFTADDQELLTAFTSQATIAIENARLYTMTDQALAARVEELSVMQRIDRELNASLDIERAMRITLDWALRQSSADAGLVGTVEEAGVHIMTAHGYDGELDAYWSADGREASHLPASALHLETVIESGRPQCLAITDFPSETFGILNGAEVQIVVPLRRETAAIGVLLLESKASDSCPDEVLDFLSRLGDHAAIATSNALLYEEIMDANLAKSKFVSFVAHELKNPMASIKGYTELVSGGMAGPVNEMQASFLETVRSNVDRMNTIVSDLNDLTKIQVGNLRLDFRVVQVKEVLEEVIRSMHRQIDEKEQQLTLNLPDGLPLVWVDPSRLEQIVTNLVSNAHKYTPQGGTLMVGAEIYVSQDEALSGGEFIHIWVEDHGIGIPEEDQKEIFGQYFRTEAAKEMAAGTGLGLNITKSLVEMQGGKIWFESKAGEGTTFHFTVPVAETA